MPPSAKRVPDKLKKGSPTTPYMTIGLFLAVIVTTMGWSVYFAAMEPDAQPSGRNAGVQALLILIGRALGPGLSLTLAILASVAAVVCLIGMLVLQVRAAKRRGDAMKAYQTQRVQAPDPFAEDAKAVFGDDTDTTGR